MTRNDLADGRPLVEGPIVRAHVSVAVFWLGIALFAGLFYDCGGHLSLGKGAGLVPASVEEWLRSRTATEDTAHLLHCPSHPMGWTAGKWREWYPDLLDSTGSAVAPVLRDEAGGKYLWQPGWWRQHQALLDALSSQTRRKALVVSGDLHALVTQVDRVPASEAGCTGSSPVEGASRALVGHQSGSRKHSVHESLRAWRISPGCWR